MKLAELQRRMLEDVMRPSRCSRAGYVKPNARLTSTERLELYRDQYWSRLLDSLRDDFPGLLRVLGERRFRKMAVEYLSQYPSRSFTLRDLGCCLPAWLGSQEKYSGLPLDMAVLEWAHIQTWDAAELPALGPEDLASAGPDLRFVLQPHLQLLTVGSPVDDVRLGTLSVRAAKARRSGPIYLATHRVDGDVFYRRLEQAEFLLLQRLAAGKSLAQAVRGIEGLPEDLQRWFATWAQLGWLCPKRTSAKRPVR